MRRINISVKLGFLIPLAFSVLVIPLKWIAAWYFASIVHELGHLICIWFYGIPVRSISVNGFGVRIETEPIPYPSNVYCALSGPVAGLSSLLLLRVCPRVALCALLQSCWNLLPLFPMDGGQVTRSILQKLIPQYAERAENIITQVCITLISIGIFYFTVRFSLGFVPVLVWGIFLLRNKKEKLLANGRH